MLRKISIAIFLVLLASIAIAQVVDIGNSEVITIPKETDKVPVSKELIVAKQLIDKSYQIQVPHYVYNDPVITILPNGSTETVITTKEITYTTETIAAYQELETSEVTVGTTTFIDDANNLKCVSKSDRILCDSTLDGNGDGICQFGESCVEFTNTEIIAKGQYDKLSTVAIEAVAVTEYAKGDVLGK